MKSYYFKFSYVLLIFQGAVSGYGQQTDLKNEQRIEELVESMAEVSDAGTESTLLLEDLNYYASHPILINQVTEEELLRLNLLNFKQVRCIIDYREKYGRILTLHELSVTGEFSEKLLEKIKPFVLFEQEPDSMQKSRGNFVHHNFLARIKRSFPTSDGYFPDKGKPPVYIGSPYSSFLKYRGDVGTWLEIGITMENDAGEDFFQQSNKTFDFLSGFICWNGSGLVQKVVVGDFHLRFGQGINLWSGGGVSYVSDLSSLMRSGDGIRPYSSSDENLFFRGVAVQLGMKPAKISLFFSDRQKDASLTADSTGNNLITSFKLDGFHRTISELANEKNAGERLMGGYADFRFTNWRFGILASFRKFEFPVTKGEAAYKSKTFEGEANINFGLDYHLILNQISLFGEAGISRNLQPAVVNGIVWKAHPLLSLSILYRSYDPSFHSFNSGAYGEGSGGHNEKGLFTAFEFYPAAKVKIAGQADLFYFPWMTYQTISPARGRTLSFQAEIAVRPELLVYFHSRFVSKPQKTSGIPGVPEQWDEETSKFRIHCDWKVSEKVQLRTRIEQVGYKFNGKKENGILFFQDLILSVSPKLKCWFRAAYYRTDGFNSRVYCFENDLLYYFAIPEFHGEGIRSYINLKWQPVRLLSLYWKAGYTFREGTTEMGSGNDVTPGNYRLDLRGQICLKF